MLTSNHAAARPHPFFFSILVALPRLFLGNEQAFSAGADLTGTWTNKGEWAGTISVKQTGEKVTWKISSNNKLYSQTFSGKWSGKYVIGRFTQTEPKGTPQSYKGTIKIFLTDDCHFMMGKVIDYFTWTKKKIDDKFLEDMIKICDVSIPKSAKIALNNCKNNGGFHTVSGAKTRYNIVAGTPYSQKIWRGLGFYISTSKGVSTTPRAMSLAWSPKSPDELRSNTGFTLKRN